MIDGGSEFRMDDFSREELSQLREMFRHQSLELLEEMNQDLLALEREGLSDELIRRVRRAAHTIKGDAVCVELSGITEVAHRMESFFDAVINDAGRFSSASVNIIFITLDAIRTAISEPEISDLTPAEVSAICARFNDPELLARVAAQPETIVSKTAEAATTGATPVRTEYVRVAAGVLDALMNLAGEMLIAGSVMNDLGAKLENDAPGSDLSRHFQQSNERLSQLLGELQKTVLEMRMVPISTLFRRFARPMRELAAETGRQLDFATHGGETELDRSVVDLLYEPLLHLLRNSVDHGLETPEARLAAGKPETGTIRLSAHYEGNQVIVEVGDDGRGIDVAAVRRRFLETGDELTAGQVSEMTDEEVMNLIFLPGLSTAKEITWVSGRGVGMAAVKSAIEQLRGQISVQSAAGRGTKFTLRLPLTLAIIRALLFTASGRLYALPLITTSEIALVSISDLALVDGLEVCRLREQWVSLIRPGLVLKHERRRGGAGSAMRGAGSCYVVTLKSKRKRFGVIADEVLGEQELVIKPLDSEWFQSDVLAGASVLGDGRVVLILDAGSLIRKAISFERERAPGIGIYTA